MKKTFSSEDPVIEEIAALANEHYGATGDLLQLVATQQAESEHTDRTSFSAGTVPWWRSSRLTVAALGACPSDLLSEVQGGAPLAQRIAFSGLAESIDRTRRLWGAAALFLLDATVSNAERQSRGIAAGRVLMGRDPHGARFHLPPSVQEAYAETSIVDGDRHVFLGNLAERVVPYAGVCKAFDLEIGEAGHFAHRYLSVPSLKSEALAGGFEQTAAQRDASSKVNEQFSPEVLDLLLGSREKQSWESDADHAGRVAARNVGVQVIAAYLDFEGEVTPDVAVGIAWTRSSQGLADFSFLDQTTYLLSVAGPDALSDVELKRVRAAFELAGLDAAGVMEPDVRQGVFDYAVEVKPLLERSLTAYFLQSPDVPLL